MSYCRTIVLVAALLQVVECFQSGRWISSNHVSTVRSLNDKSAISTSRCGASVSDVEPQVGISDIRRMIDESAVSLMKRFWEIDLQTQRRMDMILRLYEVTF